MKTRYDKIVKVEDICTPHGAGSMQDIIDLAKMEKCMPAEEDKKKVMLFAIDMQIAFMEGIGTLPVPNSKEDVKNLTKWIYDNLTKITRIGASVDVHSVHQIFHPDWWINENGRHPKPYTIITYEDVVNGVWKPAVDDSMQSIEYLYKLEKMGKKQLCIWPYHALQGTYDTCFEYEFAKMMAFHSVVRQTSPFIIQKGQYPSSEMYGIFKPEVGNLTPMGMRLLDMIKKFDLTVFAGEAKSHCLLESLIQALEFFGTYKPEVTKKIVLLEDCTSCIPGYEKETNEKLANLKEKYGFKIVKSTEFKL